MFMVGRGHLGGNEGAGQLINICVRQQGGKLGRVGQHIDGCTVILQGVNQGLVRQRG